MSFCVPIIALVSLIGSAQRQATKPIGETGFSSSTARVSTAGSPRSPATRSEKTTPTPSASSTAPCRRRTDKYTTFDSKFGHLFYERQKFSYYIVAAEYRFIGEQVAGGPDWAIRNNGLMLHSQSPQSMWKDQDFPISVEVQLLGGLPNGKPRSTANMCSPGTQVFINGTMVKGHCLNSKSQTYAGDQWVRVEVEVRGGERLIHKVEGQTVLEYEKPTIGGGEVNKFDPAVKVDGTLLTDGYIAIQGESHPTEFRKIEVLNLSGCMDSKSPKYKSYYVHQGEGACK